jgi:L-fuconolactonase
LPICDAHRHPWDYPNARYLLPELLADIGSGHNVETTVFVECRSFYRADGATELPPAGETEFVKGVAAMAASGRYGKARVCAGIVGHADLTRGGAVDSVLAEEVRIEVRPQLFRPRLCHQPDRRPSALKADACIMTSSVARK